MDDGGGESPRGLWRSESTSVRRSSQGADPDSDEVRSSSTTPVSPTDRTAPRSARGDLGGAGAPVEPARCGPRAREDRRRHVRYVRALRAADRCRTARGPAVGAVVHRLQAGRGHGVTEALVPGSWSSSATPGASGTRPMRRPTATRAPTRWRTPAGRSAASTCRRSSASASGCSPTSRESPRERRPGTAHGRATERSAGKDTTTGHWEMMGIRLDEPFPLYPHGFPPEIVEPFERAIGRRGPGQRAGVGHRDHRSTSDRSISHRLTDRVHERGLGVPDRVPQVGGRPRTALRVVPDRPAPAGWPAPRRTGDRSAVRG